MRHILSAVSIAAVMMACNSNPKTTVDTVAKDTTTIDTTGLAQFQEWKAQNELGEQNNNLGEAGVAAAAATRATSTAPARRTTRSSNATSTRSRSTASSGTSNSGSGSSGTASTGTAGTTEKKGWSKTAKGAVIGGVVGAGTGAVINKKNRAAGAVIGGVVGAGAGAVIGRDMGKKDGRRQ